MSGTTSGGTLGLRCALFGRRCCLMLSLCIVGFAGCQSGQYVSLRKIPQNPLEGPLQLLSRKGPQPTARTVQLLRRYDLENDLKENGANLLVKLQKLIQEEPTPDKVYAFAELAYINGKRAETLGRDETALDYYGGSVTHAYLYLFDDRFDIVRNAYDPQFRSACDLYNVALESTMRITHKHGGLQPGKVQTLKIGEEEFEVEVAVRGSWPAEDIDHLEFVSDYEVQGLTNHYHTFGLGVPLIAVREPSSDDAPNEQFYPPGVSFPVTAFLRVCSAEKRVDEQGNKHRRCVLELYDPLAASEITVAGRQVPLETDLSTPIAYLLNQPEFREQDLATAGFLNPGQAEEAKGLYLLEPYDPRKVPVLMVHGLWSSPMTWMEMFNDLRALPEIRDNYQFWFYLYPTGQPFWISATAMRSDIQAAREILDPERQALALDQAVLVGHSMGGLVSRWQTVDSGDDFWGLVSNRSPDELQGRRQDREGLKNLLFFEPNPGIRRVVTMGTPHRGSDFANDYTRWLSRKLIALPDMLVRAKQRIVRDNPGFFRETEMFAINTSIDSLAPDSPVLPALLNAQAASWTKYHNVVGVVSQDGWLSRFAGEGDGVVAYSSAHLDNVESEITVEADHVNIHRHPRAVLEMRRILLEHVDQIRHEYLTGTDPRGTALPAAYHSPQDDELPADRVGRLDEQAPSGGTSPSGATSPLRLVPGDGDIPPTPGAEAPDSWRGRNAPGT
jgi:pimeloyl-ACP methyl ester carboxylesterase